jgi:hypothetical protein
MASSQQSKPPCADRDQRKSSSPGQSYTISLNSTAAADYTAPIGSLLVYYVQNKIPLAAEIYCRAVIKKFSGGVLSYGSVSLSNVAPMV